MGTVGGTVPPPVIGRRIPPASRLRGATASDTATARNQLLHMLNNMREHMKEQQARSDRNREQAALDCDNVICEQEVLR